MSPVDATGLSHHLAPLLRSPDVSEQTLLTRATHHLAQWLHPEHHAACRDDPCHRHLLEVVQGCAGSCKTSFMLYRALHFAHAACHPDTCADVGLPPNVKATLLVLTKTGSVTDEILQRLRVALGGMSHYQQGHHSILEVAHTETGVPYLFRDSGGDSGGDNGGDGSDRSGGDGGASTPQPQQPIVYTTPGMHLVIANFDAWVQEQLTRIQHTHPLLVIPPGDQFQEKLATLAEWVQTYRCDTFYCKGVGGYMGTGAHYVAVDEYQDIPTAYIRVVCDIQANAINATHTTHVSTASTAPPAPPAPPPRVRFVGDLLQSVFHNGQDGQPHPLDYVRSLPYTQQLAFRVNHRCPQAHLTLANAIMRPYQKLYQHGPMEADNHNVVDKPVCFAHLPIHSSSSAAFEVAQQVAGMVRAFMENDPTLGPGDVSVIMRKTNANVVFEHMTNTLQQTFQSLLGAGGAGGAGGESGASGGVRHMKTQYADGHVPLQWAHTKDQCLLLSVCGDKGRHHKLVIALGVTEGSIPLQTTVNKAAELGDQSHMNVLLTRSTKYLCVGFTHVAPSRYIYDCHQETPMEELCYCPWRHVGLAEPDTGPAPIPVVYVRVMEQCRDLCTRALYSFPQMSPSVSSKRYPRKTITMMDDPDPLSVTEITTRKTAYIPNVHSVWPSFPSDYQVTESFGSRVSFVDVFRRATRRSRPERVAADTTDTTTTDTTTTDTTTTDTITTDTATDTTIDERLYECLGELCELMLLRLHQPAYVVTRLRAFLHLRETGCIYYTDNGKALSHQHDSASTFWLTFLVTIDPATTDPATADPTPTRRRWKVPTAFRSVHTHVEALLRATNNRDVPFGTWWNVHLLWKTLAETRLHQPTLPQYYGWFDAPEEPHAQQEHRVHQQLCTNIDVLYARMRQRAPAPALRFQYLCALDDRIDSSDKRRLQQHGVQSHHHEWAHGFHWGVTGRCDVYDTHTQTLYELKASHRQQCASTWQTQAGLYAGLLLHHSDVSRSAQVRTAHRVRTVTVVNMLRGTLYTYPLSETVQREGAGTVGRVLERLGYDSLCVLALRHRPGVCR